MEERFSKVVSIEDINNGAISDLFSTEFKKVLNNLADENTSWKTQREVNIKLKIKLNSEKRDSAVSMVEVTAKIAPPKANERIIHLDFDGRDVTAHAMKETEQLELNNITNIEEAQ